MKKPTDEDIELFRKAMSHVITKEFGSFLALHETRIPKKESQKVEHLIVKLVSICEQYSQEVVLSAIAHMLINLILGDKELQLILSEVDVYLKNKENIKFTGLYQ